MHATIRRYEGVVTERTANRLAAAWLRGSGRGECR